MIRSFVVDDSAAEMRRKGRLLKQQGEAKMPTSPSACQETSHWPRAEERKAEERMVLQNYAFTVSSLLPRLLLHWPTKKCSPLSQSTKYTDSSTVETTPRAPGRGQNQSRSALNSASHSGERRRGVALTHAEVVRRDGCWQSDGLADLDGAGARGGLQLPALHRGAPCTRHSQRQRRPRG